MAGQDIFDLIIVVSLVIFTWRGIRSGFVGEAAGIVSLLGGFWAAREWNSQVAPYLDFISDPSLRIIAACALIFIVVMLAIGILARILKKLISFSFVAWADRLAGAALGLAKGLLVWALIIIVLEAIFQNAPFMAESRALPYFKVIIDQIKQWLPPDLANHIQAG